VRRITLTAEISVAICGLALAQTAVQPLKGPVERIKVHGASLEGNLEGDSPDREVSIYLPPSYQTSPNRRYPVLYILHGFTDRDDHWFGAKPNSTNVPALLEADLDKGAAREMILVMPNAYTRYAGSFYGSSVAIGDWETFVTQELVTFIDGHYRTLTASANRGLAGHSMGGYGAIRLAMKHPGVYSSVYAMSACCLTPDIPTANTIEKAEAVRTVEDFDKADFGTKVAIGLAAAWSANPKTASYFDLPRKDGKPQSFVIAEWYANSPVAMLGQYAANLKKLHALALDIGLQDGLLAENQLLDRLLSDLSVPHTFETYEGTHTSKIGDRLETKVLPYFTKNLSFDTELPSRDHQ
jgi:S-formylglutathione hydrolase